MKKRRKEWFDNEAIWREGYLLMFPESRFTGAAETMECVAGGCEYRLAGSDLWQPSGPGHQFSVPANSSFDIRVTQAYHYICHFG